MKKFYIVLLLAFLSCNSKKNNQKIGTDSKEQNSIKMKPQDSTLFQDVMLLNKHEAVQKYGEPDSHEKFLLDDALGEFRNSITDKFTKKERQNESVLIDEVTWEKDKDTWITVWYQIKEDRAFPKSSYIWKKGTEF